MNQAVTVFALNHYVKAMLESDENLRSIWVEGELSGFKPNSSSGHLYFTLRDERASVFSVMFRSSAERLRFLPQDGMKVLVRGRVSLYEKGGSYQLIVDEMQPSGIGEQNMRLRELQEKLSAEGLFSDERKRPIPRFPSTIAVITSRDAAAFQDIIKVLSRRYPMAKLLLCHSSVQGIFAEDELVDAIRLANGTGADVAIISRGGGSKEDLFVFNSEKVVRAAAELKMPFISAVGHETDVTLIDLVSDTRAPTPSAAAEIASPDAGVIETTLSAMASRMGDELMRQIDISADQTALTRQELFSAWDESALNRAGSLEKAKEALGTSMQSKLNALEASLVKLAAVSDSVSPLAVLARGYCRVSSGGASITRRSQLKGGQQVTMSFADGDVASVISEEL